MKQTERLRVLDEICDKVRDKRDNTFTIEDAYDKYKERVPFDVEVARHTQFERDMERLERREWLDRHSDDQLVLFGPGNWPYYGERHIKLAPNLRIKLKNALSEHVSIDAAST